MKVRAAEQGLSLSDYLLREIERVAARPTLDQLLTAIAADGRAVPSETSAAAVRREREAR